MKNTTIITIIYILCLASYGYAQESAFKTPDSLKIKEYEYLFKELEKHFKDYSKANIYAQTFLNKAKQNLDSTQIIEGYYYLALLNEPYHDKLIQYADSAIFYGKNLKTYQNIAYVYTVKANEYFVKGEYNLALDNYIAAKKNAEQKGQTYLLFKIDYNIGLLKLRIGDYESALTNFRKTYDLILETELGRIEPDTYISTLMSLSYTFYYNQEIDSATYYNLLALQESKKNNFPLFNQESKIIQGVLNYSKGNYTASRDSILKYAPFIEASKNDLNLFFTYSYLGKTYMKLNDPEKALRHLKNADTIVQRIANLNLIEIRENYNVLYNYYKQQGDSENQLIYLEKFINFDSILFSYSTHLKNALLIKYDAPKLIEEKESLINELQNKTSKNRQIVYLLSLLIGCLLLVSFYYYRKKQIYEKRFASILSKDYNSPWLTKPIKKEKIQISEEILTDVLHKIENFEENKGFLDSSISLNSLSKSFGTNSTYLSKIINLHKEKNFSTYLTDLRINHTILALQEQNKLRAYTIKAIAFEMGFKNAESFTKAFHRHTGLYPSYFIKQLQKRALREETDT